MPALEHILCVVILIGRIGDIGSTYLVTPGLRLEANPVARKLRWPFALLTVLVCLVPYWNTPLAVPIAVTSLVVTAENLRFGWIARALGEDELLAFLQSQLPQTVPQPVNSVDVRASLKDDTDAIDAVLLRLGSQ